MPEILTLKEYLETSSETSRRVRYSTVIVVVVSVLILAGLLNSLVNHSWIRNRIKYRQEYSQKIKDTINSVSFDCPIALECDEKNDELYSYLKSYSTDNFTIDEKDVLKSLPPMCGQDETNCLCKTTKEEKLQCLECSRDLNQKILEHLTRLYVENVYIIRVPFFGVVFDINDLGLIGGIRLVLVLIILRLSLRSYIMSLRIAYKSSFSRNKLEQSKREEFYEILATRQLFVFPQLFDENQEYYAGMTEEIWNKSTVKKVYLALQNYFSSTYSQLIKRTLKNTLIFFTNSLIGIVLLLFAIPTLIFIILLMGFYINLPYLLYTLLFLWLIQIIFYIRNPKKLPPPSLPQKYWMANPQPWLKRVSKIISIIPSVVYLMVVINDFRSLHTGMVVDYWRAIFGFIFSIIFLIVIFSIGCWCVSKWYEIDKIWIDFYKETFNYEKILLEK